VVHVEGRALLADVVAVQLCRVDGERHAFGRTPVGGISVPTVLRTVRNSDGAGV
jgi:hypothetical protein